MQRLQPAGRLPAHTHCLQALVQCLGRAALVSAALLLCCLAGLPVCHCQRLHICADPLCWMLMACTAACADCWCMSCMQAQHPASLNQVRIEVWHVAPSCASTAWHAVAAAHAGCQHSVTQQRKLIAAHAWRRQQKRTLSLRFALRCCCCRLAWPRFSLAFLHQLTKHQGLDSYPHVLRLQASWPVSCYIGAQVRFPARMTVP